MTLKVRWYAPPIGLLFAASAVIVAMLVRGGGLVSDHHRLPSGGAGNLPFITQLTPGPDQPSVGPTK